MTILRAIHREGWVWPISHVKRCGVVLANYLGGACPNPTTLFAAALLFLSSVELDHHFIGLSPDVSLPQNPLVFW